MPLVELFLRGVNLSDPVEEELMRYLSDTKIEMFGLAHYCYEKKKWPPTKKMGEKFIAMVQANKSLKKLITYGIDFPIKAVFEPLFMAVRDHPYLRHLELNLTSTKQVGIGASEHLQLQESIIKQSNCTTLIIEEKKVDLQPEDMVLKFEILRDLKKDCKNL